MKRWWLSFCDPKRPEGEQFLGLAIVEAADVTTCTRVAWARGINPGGEVQMMEIEPANMARLSFDLSEYFDRFIPRDEALALTARIDAELDS